MLKRSFECILKFVCLLIVPHIYNKNIISFSFFKVVQLSGMLLNF